LQNSTPLPAERHEETVGEMALSARRRRVDASKLDEENGDG
jgi:hypothetical protein